MVLASQFPCSPIWQEIEDVFPSSTTRIHARLFSSQIISPNVVTAIYTLLKVDKQSILKYVPLWEQQYILRVLCILAPKEKYNLLGFGRMANDEIDENNDGDEGTARVGKTGGGQKKRQRDTNTDGKRAQQAISNKKSVLGKGVTISDEYNVTTQVLGLGLGQGNSKKKRVKLTLKGKTFK